MALALEDLTHSALGKWGLKLRGSFGAGSNVRIQSIRIPFVLLRSSHVQRPTNGQGLTALQLAASHGQVEAVKLLLSLGAVFDAKTADGPGPQRGHGAPHQSCKSVSFANHDDRIFSNCDVS